MRYNSVFLSILSTVYYNQKIRSAKFFITKNKYTSDLLNVLLEEGYITSYTKYRQQYLVYSKYNSSGFPALQLLKKFSNSDIHIYKNYNVVANIVNTKPGVFLFWTHFGLLTGQRCVKYKIGGRLIAYLE